MTGDLAANFLEIFKLTLELLSGRSLIVQLLLELWNICLATHIANLRLSWLYLWHRFQIIGHFTNFIPFLLLVYWFLDGGFFFISLLDWVFLHDWSGRLQHWLRSGATEEWMYSLGSCLRERLSASVNGFETSDSRFFWWWGLILGELFVESLKSSLTQSTSSITCTSVWVLIKSLYLTISVFTSSLWPRACLLSLVNKFALAGISKLARIVLHVLHLWHLSSKHWELVLSKLPLLRWYSLFHMLSLKVVDQVWVVEPLPIILIHLAVHVAWLSFEFLIDSLLPGQVIREVTHL